MNVKVKICGITCVEDAVAAVAAGADALGFMFYEPSPRYVTSQMAAEIIRQLPPFVAKVGVFVNASSAQIRDLVTACGLDAVQLHGEELPAACLECAPIKVIKAFRVQDATSLASLSDYLETDAWLLDSFVPGQRGGTGARFNWDLAIQAKQLGRPILLAGGLTPDNVADAVRKVRPFGVDVSSGVELAPGRKDPAKMQALVQHVRQASRD